MESEHESPFVVVTLEGGEDTRPFTEWYIRFTGGGHGEESLSRDQVRRRSKGVLSADGRTHPRVRGKKGNSIKTQ